MDRAKRVLLVEDDMPTAWVLAKLLRNFCEVIRAEDGARGLSCAMATPGLDLIITDVTMPGMDGFSMVKQIKSIAALRWTPVVFLTANNTPMDIIQGIQAGARHYLTKPISLEIFEGKVRRLLRSSP